jgi:hypothetical protein
MNRLIDERSPISTKSELDLFSIPSTQVAIKRSYNDIIHPSNPITNEGPYQFRIPGDPNFLSLSNHNIYFQTRIVRADGTNLNAAGDNPDPLVATINAIGKTFFRQVKLFLNSKLVFDSGDKYHYKAFLETELNYGSEAKTSHLSSCMYNKESGDIDNAANTGFISRATAFANSQWVECMAPLHVDLMTQERLLMPHTEVRLELYRNPDPLLLLCYQANPPRGYKLEIREMKLFMKKVEVLPSISLALEATVNQYAAKYPIRRTVVTSLQVTQQRRLLPTNTIFQGDIPRRLIVGCVDTDAYHGAINKTPFAFKNYHIQSIKVTAGGQSFPAQPLRLDFANKIYLQAYVQLLEALCLEGDNKGNCITREDFAKSHTLFGFNLTDADDDSCNWELVKQGSTNLEIEFGANQIPDSGVTILVYAELDSLLTLDRNRVAHFDYSA